MGRTATAAQLGGFVAAVAAAYSWLSASPAPETMRPAPQRRHPAPTLPALPAVASAPAPVSAVGLALYGVSGRSPNEMAAIIGSSSGGHRLVPVGRDYRPGLRLTEVGADYALLASGAQVVRLELSRFGSPGGAAAPLPPEAERKIEAAVLRHILKPVMSNNRIGGYVLKPGESLPQLRRAGLEAGDVIVSVNGSQFDEERMNDLAAEMANATMTEFLFIRNGKKMRAMI